MYLYDDQARIKNVFLYIRQSTDERSGKQVRSKEDQRAECQVLAERIGLKIVETFIEEKSARKPHNRPVFKQMIKALSYKSPSKRRADGVLAWNPDRLSRNALESGQLMQMLDDELIKDMFFPSYSYHNDPSGNEHLALEFARAKGYVDRLSMSVMRGTQSREKTGAMIYPVKFGYQKRREVPEKPKLCSLFPIPCETNFHIIQKVFKLRLAGSTIDEILSIVKKERCHTVKSTVSRSAVSRWLCDPFYFGHWIINPGQKNERNIDLNNITLFDGTIFTPVVSEADFWKCQRSATGQMSARKTIRHTNPLSVYVNCHRCHGHMRPAIRKIKKSGGIIDPQLGYECQTILDAGNRCPQGRVKGSVLFEKIAERIAHINIGKRQYQQFIIGLEYFLKKKKESLRKDRIKLSRQINSLKEKKTITLQRKAVLIESGDFTKDDREHYNERIKEINKSLSSAEIQYQEIGQDVQNRVMGFKKFIERCQNLHQDWINADNAQKRKISEKILLNLTVEGSQIQSVTWKEPFNEWLDGAVFSCGRDAVQKIEPWFERLWCAYQASSISTGS